MTRKLRIIGKMGPTSLLLSTALAACTVGPDYTAPKTELAPFHNAADASSAQATRRRRSIGGGPGSTTRCW